MGRKNRIKVDDPVQLTPTTGCCHSVRGRLCSLCRGIWTWFFNEFTALMQESDKESDKESDTEVVEMELREVREPTLIDHWACISLITPDPMSQATTPSPLHPGSNSPNTPPTVQPHQQHPAGIRVLFQQPQRPHFFRDFIERENAAEAARLQQRQRRPLGNLEDMVFTTSDESASGSGTPPDRWPMAQAASMRTAPKRPRVMENPLFNMSRIVMMKVRRRTQLAAMKAAATLNNLELLPFEMPHTRRRVVPSINVSSSEPEPSSSSDHSRRPSHGSLSSSSLFSRSNSTTSSSSNEVIFSRAELNRLRTVPRVPLRLRPLDAEFEPSRTERSRSLSPRRHREPQSMLSLPEWPDESPGEASLQETDIGSLASGTLSFADDTPSVDSRDRTLFGDDRHQMPPPTAISARRHAFAARRQQLALDETPTPPPEPRIGFPDTPTPPPPPTTPREPPTPLPSPLEPVPFYAARVKSYSFCGAHDTNIVNLWYRHEIIDLLPGEPTPMEVRALQQIDNHFALRDGLAEVVNDSPNCENFDRRHSMPHSPTNCSDVASRDPIVKSASADNPHPFVVPPPARYHAAPTRSTSPMSVDDDDDNHHHAASSTTDPYPSSLSCGHLSTGGLPSSGSANTPFSSDDISPVAADDVFMHPLATPSTADTSPDTQFVAANTFASGIARSIIASAGIASAVTPYPSAIAAALAHSTFAVASLASPQDMELSSSTSDCTMVTVVSSGNRKSSGEMDGAPALIPEEMEEQMEEDEAKDRDGDFNL